jgi:hypothetical protein
VSDSTCSVCHRPDVLDHQHPTTCRDCVTAARRDLRDLDTAYELLPDELTRVGSPSDWRRTGPRGTERQIPGGDVLSLLAEGSWGPSDGPHARDQDATAPSVAFELHVWQTDVAEQHHALPRGTGRTFITEHPTVPVTVERLLRDLDWAAQNYELFPDLAGELRRLRTIVERHTGQNDATMHGAARCPKCGDTLERTDRRRIGCHINHQGQACDCDRGGLDDHWRCPNCHAAYTPSEYLEHVANQLRAKKAAETV